MPFVQQLPEHLHARHHPLHRRPEAHNLHLLAYLHFAALDPPRHHRAASRDRENILNRHRKRLVHIPLRQRNVLVHRFHQLQRSSSPTSLRRSALPAPSRESPESCRRETDSSSAARALPVPPAPATPDLPPRRTCSKTPRSYGTPTCRASRMCSRVCGIGPSVAATTRIAPSICAAPVIMFLM